MQLFGRDLLLRVWLVAGCLSSFIMMLWVCFGLLTLLVFGLLCEFLDLWVNLLVNFCFSFVPFYSISSCCVKKYYWTLNAISFSLQLLNFFFLTVKCFYCNIWFKFVDISSFSSISSKQYWFFVWNFMDLWIGDQRSMITPLFPSSRFSGKWVIL